MVEEITFVGETLFNKLWDSTIDECVKAKGKGQCIRRVMRAVLRDFPFRERLGLSADVKDTAKAFKLRIRADMCRIFGCCDSRGEVIKYTNERIALAEKGSVERALAYEYRAMICLEQGRDEECLVNIRLARESNYPQRFEEKLKRYEAAAKNGLKKPRSATDVQRETVEELKLSYKCHPNVPQMVECLQLRRNKEFGRHVVTTENLKAGDVVIIEKPFATMLYDDVRYLRCAHCHDANPLTLIPCEGCTMAMYCSEECLSKAHQQYHRYECAILRDSWRISGMSRTGMIGLRTVAMAIALFDHDFEALKEHLNGLDESKVDAFTMDWRTATPKDVYNTVHVLSTNQERRGRKALALEIFYATIIHELMLERTELGAICAADAEKRELLYKLILRHWQIAQVNSLALTNMQSKGVEIGWEKHVRATLPLISMLNHSCVPNVMRVPFRDERCAIVAIRPIAAGEQLFDCYRLNANQLATADRVLCWKNCYQFICRCAACVRKRNTDDYFNEEDQNIVKRVTNMSLVQNKRSASKAVQLLISYLNATGRNFPTHRLTEPQMMVMQFLLLLHSTVIIDFLPV